MSDFWFQQLPRSSSNSTGAIGDNAMLAAAQSAATTTGGSGGLKNTLSVPGISKSRAASGKKNYYVTWNYFPALRKTSTTILHWWKSYSLVLSGPQTEWKYRVAPGIRFRFTLSMQCKI